MGVLLYSTNAWITWEIKRRYYNDTHFVWCSEYFDPEAKGVDHSASLIPMSSSPAEIYRRLENEANTDDRRPEQIQRVRAGMTRAVTNWRSDDEITEEDYQEIIELLNSPGNRKFRPVVYLIPRANIVGGRIELVPPGERAGDGQEYRITDLKGDEFDWMRYRNA